MYKYFLSFIGYPRSGHTLIASILNANPNVICSNQMNLYNTILPMTSKKDLFARITEYSKRRETWKATTIIPEIPKEEITVIGDKAGHRTTEILEEHPEKLKIMKQVTMLPIKWIHVVRNPYDNLATWARLNYESRKDKSSTSIKNELDICIRKYANLNHTIFNLRKTEDVLTVNHEFVITRMHNTLKQISDFLEISFDPEWRDNIRNVVWKNPRITRSSIDWTQQQRKAVTRIINKYSWFAGYEYGGCSGCKGRRK